MKQLRFVLVHQCIVSWLHSFNYLQSKILSDGVCFLILNFLEFKHYNPSSPPLAYRGVLSESHDMVCPHCWQVENLDHLFLKCPTSRQVWFLMSVWMEIDAAEEQNSLTSYFHYFTTISNWKFNSSWFFFC